MKTGISFAKTAFNYFNLALKAKSAVVQDHGKDFKTVASSSIEDGVCQNLDPNDPKNKELVFSGTDKHLESVSKIPVVGGFLSKTMNLLGSNAVSTGGSIVAAGATLFSPLGVAVGAVGAVTTLATTGYNAYSKVKTLRDLDNLKIRRALLEEIIETNKKIAKNLEEMPELSRLMSRYMMSPIEKLNKSKTSVKTLPIAAEKVLSAAPSMGYSLISSALAGANPVAIGVSLITNIFARKAEVEREKAYQTELAKFEDYLTKTQEKAGFSSESQTPSIAQLTEVLSRLRSNNEALESFENTYKTKEWQSMDDEAKMLVFLKVLNAVPEVKMQVQEADLASSFKKWRECFFSMQENNRLYVPSRNELYNDLSYETYSKALSDMQGTKVKSLKRAQDQSITKSFAESVEESQKLSVQSESLRR